MNILITGVHGFVGSNLVKALVPEHTIFGLDIAAPKKEGVKKTFFWEDLPSTSLGQSQLLDFKKLMLLFTWLVRLTTPVIRAQQMCTSK